MRLNKVEQGVGYAVQRADGEGRHQNEQKQQRQGAYPQNNRAHIDGFAQRLIVLVGGGVIIVG